MVAPSHLFANFSDMFDFCPRRYLSVWDLWLNAYAKVRKGMKLRRSRNPEHSSRAPRTDTYDDKITLSVQPGIRDLKTEMIQFLSKRDGHPFTGEIGSFDTEWKRAMSIANDEKSTNSQVIKGFRHITRNWPARGMPFNNLAVAYLRAAVSNFAPDNKMYRKNLDLGMRAAQMALELDGVDRELVQTNIKEIDKALDKIR
jgi:hypothetical protein